nr:uncharacterized protein LOC117997353 [Maniola hyperantus]
MFVKNLWFLCIIFYLCKGDTRLKFEKPPREGHRCGICPTYMQKLCGFDFQTNQTYIFDNICIMDLFNCIHGTEFIKLNYENCLYFGNFAYVHGIKHEDYDYGEDHISITNSKKNPDFVRQRH